MGRILKRILKIVLGIIVLLVLVIVVLIALYWDSVGILRGTQDLGEQAQAIPNVPVTTQPLRDRGDADWPCWRGLHGDAKSPVTGISKDWSKGLKQLWEVNYLCQGQGSATWSAPVIQGDRLIVCGRDEGHDLIFCLNALDGNLLWHNQYAASADNDHGTGMRATPCIDADRVYTFGRSGDLVCWNLNDGSIMWHKKVGDEGGRAPTWGHSSSPLVSEDMVLVQGGGTARALAYNKLTGEVIWKSGQGDAGYAPLVPMTLGDTPAYLVFHGKGLAAVASDTGTALWDAPWETRYGVNATTPLIHGDQVLITSGYGTGIQLLQASHTEAKVLWTGKAISAHHTDGYILNGFVYGYSGLSMQNRGAFKCVDLSTGTEKWSTRAMGWGTCTQVDHHLLCLDIKGNLFLMRPDPERFIKVTALPQALGAIKGPAWTVPVIANDRLYLRFKQRLRCYALQD